jgi:hypothetical protein
MTSGANKILLFTSNFLVIAFRPKVLMINLSEFE